MRNNLLSVPEVAEYLGVSEVTVYRWCREGIVPALKVGRTWRIRQSTLEEFLKQSERPTTLAGHLRAFLRVPDNILAITQEVENIHRLEAAFFRVGEARGGRLVKFFNEQSRSSLEELRNKFTSYGLNVARLEHEERFHFVSENGDPTGKRIESLQRLLSEEEDKRIIWASFNWYQSRSQEEAIKQQRDLTKFVEDKWIAVITVTMEKEADEWQPMFQRRVPTLHTGVIWLSEEGLMMSRLTPLSES
jgi:excisionase family DNA binding protein